jgi:N-acetylglucosaminyl-diphospho-decaprenol L-rhamnosyltransferase
MPSAALIVVNYRTSALAVDAIRSARAAFSGALQVVVVDNSVDDAEAQALRPHADVLIVSERNVGYAAAINRARKACDAASLIVANPDVVFAPSSLDALLGVGADVAGPALYWDDAHEWLLPPSELHTTAEVLDRAAASRSAAWARARDRRRVRARMKFWSLRDVTEVRALSGAVLAIRTTSFDRAQGFDERYPLYFEENDFLRRAAGRIVYVPQARCRHIYNQSAAGSAEAAAFYAASERAYLERWSGRFTASILKKLERPLPAADAVAMSGATVAARPGTWVEASPLASFDTAAGHRSTTDVVAVPDSIWKAYRASTLYLRVVDERTGAVLANHARSRMAT